MNRIHSTKPHNAPYELFSLIVNVVSLIIFTVITFTNISRSKEQILIVVDEVICVLFFIDFIHLLLTTKNKWKYLITWGWVDLISSVPNIGILQFGRLARVVRILRVLKGVKSARVISLEIIKRRTQSIILSAILLTGIFITVGSISILQLETDPTSNIKTAEDAIWWAVTTITTVGYGDKYPVTTEGRIVAVFLMAFGIGLFGLLAGLVASWFMTKPEKEEEDQTKLLKKLLENVNTLSEEMIHLRTIVESKNNNSIIKDNDLPIKDNKI